MKNIKKSNNKSNFNAQERKNLQNKIYTWLIFALIVFWTISSVLGIIGFSRSFVTTQAESVAVCETLDTEPNAQPVSRKRVLEKSMRYGEENAVPYSAEDFGTFNVPLPIFANYFYTTFFLRFVHGVPIGLFNTIYKYDQSVALMNDIYHCDFEDVHLEINGYAGYEQYPASIHGCYANSNYSCYVLKCNVFLDGGASHNFDIYFWKGNLNPYEETLDQDYWSFTYCLTSYFPFARYNEFIALFNEYNQGGASEEELEQAYNNGYDEGYQGGYDVGYTEGINYGKYGPFTDLQFFCYVYNVEDEGGNILADSVFLDVALPADTLFTMGFNSEPVLQAIVSRLSSMYPNFDNWQRIEAHLEFAQPFAQKQYPLLFDGNSTAFFGYVHVVSPNGSSNTYSFVYQDDGTWTLPVPNDVFIRELVWDIGGGYDGFSFTVYVQGQSYQEGFNAGSAIGYDNGYNRGNQIGYENGFTAGKAVGYNEGSLANNNFLSLLTAVVDAPLSVFYDMFDFNLLGYNMSSFFLALLSACFVLVILKLILGR